MTAYNRLIELDASGETPLYRPREWRKLDQAREKRRKREIWFKEGGFDTVIFVPATPGSQLKHRYMREIKRRWFKVKVVEQSGDHSSTLSPTTKPSTVYSTTMVTTSAVLGLAASFGATLLVFALPMLV
ncbi:hypothetical protein ACROYT_G032476 [Oculina patagonica]